MCFIFLISSKIIRAYFRKKVELYVPFFRNKPLFLENKFSQTPPDYEQGPNGPLRFKI